jgi:two-component system, OmpR family, response regulator QseB
MTQSIQMRVLLVEDEPDIRLPLQRALLAQGFEVRVAHDLPSGREAMLEIEPDLMVLDVRLLDEEDGGFILAREARASGYAGSILFLTARDALQDRVQALDDGGDDYVVKPFELLEVLARVRALLRRPTEARSSQLRFGNPVGSSVGNLELDLVRQQVSQDGARLELSLREFALLERLALSPSRVFSAEELLDAIWGESASSISVVKVNVHRLREKLGAETISSVRGGYQFGLELNHGSTKEGA